MQEIKVWSCESWDCIQTIRFEPSPTTTQPMMFKASLDLSARYLLLSNIYQKIVYVLQLQPVRLSIYFGLKNLTVKCLFRVGERQWQK